MLPCHGFPTVKGSVLVGPTPDEMWEWAEQQAASTPAWTDERWQRVNAIFGIRLADEQRPPQQYPEAA